jgi:hypothetical protein
VKLRPIFSERQCEIQKLSLFMMDLDLEPLRQKRLESE